MRQRKAGSNWNKILHPTYFIEYPIQKQNPQAFYRNYLHKIESKVENKNKAKTEYA